MLKIESLLFEKKYICSQMAPTETPVFKKYFFGFRMLLKQGTGSGERGAGNGERGTGSGERALGTGK